MRIHRRKILIVSQEFPNQPGGAGVVAFQNAEELARLGNDVTVLTLDWGFKPDPSSLVKYVLLGNCWKFWFFILALYLWRLNLEDFDVLILNDSGASFVFSCFFLRKKYFSKICVFVHGKEPQVIINSPPKNVLFSILRKRYIALLRKCRKIFLVSESLKVNFLRTFPEALNREKAIVAYAGVDSEIFAFSLYSKFENEDPNQIDRPIFLLSVGRITKDKGFDRMLAIFEEVIKINKSFIWDIVGEGPFLQELKEKVAQKGLLEKVVFHGFVLRDDLPKFYQKADLFWLLSEYESFGLVYVEAQMCGCPVMGLDIPGVNEAIFNSNGFLVKTDDECFRIILNRNFIKMNRSLVSKNAMRWCKSDCARKLDEAINFK